jgi:hypothetical protein
MDPQNLKLRQHLLNRYFMFKGLSLLFLTGCMANDGLRTMAMSQDNVWNLSRLHIGMNESEVLQIMHYPYKKQVLEKEDSVYHIWFYVTRPSELAQSRLVRQNLTPLTFEKGVLQGWGFAYYDYILRPKETTKEVEKKDSDQKSLQHVIEGIEKKPTTSDNQASPPKKGKSKKSQKEKSKTQEDEEHPNDEDNKMIKEENEQNFDFW